MVARIKFNVKDYRTRFAQSSCKKNCCDEEEFDNQVDSKAQNPNYSLDSYREEFEEEAVEIDCGVVDPKLSPDIQCKVCWDNSSTTENPLLNSC